MLADPPAAGGLTVPVRRFKIIGCFTAGQIACSIAISDFKFNFISPRAARSQATYFCRLQQK